MIKSFKSSSISNQLKRSNIADGNAYGFPFTSNLMSWFDASDPNSFTLSGSSVVEWKDKGNFISDLSQSATAARPTLQQNALNGKPIVTFDGTDDYLINRHGTQSLDRPFSTFAVARLNSSAPSISAIVFSGGVNGPAGASDAHFYFIENGRHAYWTGGRSLHAMTTLPVANAWHLIHTAQSANGIISMRVNQIAQTIQYSGVTPYDNLDTTSGPAQLESRKYNNPIMGRHPAPNNLSHYPGSIAEVLIYNQEMNSQQILEVENYLKAKWGV